MKGSLARLTHRLLLVVTLIFAHSSGLQAKIEGRQFDNASQEALYNALIQELRCVVCQNQNLSDSNAELAQDLREKTYKMVVAGNDSDEIKEYMVARYGEFVLYRPPLNLQTIVLWVGPLIILLCAVWIAVVNIRKRNHIDSDDGQAQRQQARKLLEDDQEKGVDKKEGEND